MIKKVFTSLWIVLFLSFASCGGGSSSNEAKELLQKILQLVGIPQDIVLNVCQDENRNGFCESRELQAKITIHKGDNIDDIWAKITQSDNGQYFLETYDETLPILLEVQDASRVDLDDGKFTLNFDGFETKEKNEVKELSILESMVDANHLTKDDVTNIRNLNTQYAQERFYSTLLEDFEENINRLRTDGLDSNQTIKANIKEVADELLSSGVKDDLPNRLNSCENNQSCVDEEIERVSDELVIDEDESVEIVNSLGGTTNSLSKGLVAYYKFEGNAKDSSGNGNDGVEHGGVSYSDGVIGQASSFDGVDDWIEIIQSNTLNNLRETATISFWTKYYKPTSGKNNVSVHIANGGDQNIHNEYGYFNYSTKNGIGFYLGYMGDSQSVYAPIDATKKLNEQEFVFITCVVNTQTIKVYKDNILIEEEARIYPDFSKPSNNWFIGSHKGYLYFLNGLIDDLRIYNRALDETEIAELYKMGNQ